MCVQRGDFWIGLLRRGKRDDGERGEKGRWRKGREGDFCFVGFGGRGNKVSRFRESEKEQWRKVVDKYFEFLFSWVWRKALERGRRNVGERGDI